MHDLLDAPGLGRAIVVLPPGGKGMVNGVIGGVDALRVLVFQSGLH